LPRSMSGCARFNFRNGRPELSGRFRFNGPAQVQIPPNHQFHPVIATFWRGTLRAVGNTLCSECPDRPRAALDPETCLARHPRRLPKPRPRPTPSCASKYGRARTCAASRAPGFGVRRPHSRSCTTPRRGRYRLAPKDPRAQNGGRPYADKLLGPLPRDQTQQEQPAAGGAWVGAPSQ
jgi:hypothetical protein